MHTFTCTSFLLVLCLFMNKNDAVVRSGNTWIMSTDELENGINPEDLEELRKVVTKKKRPPADLDPDVDYADAFGGVHGVSKKPDLEKNGFCLDLPIPEWFITMDVPDKINTRVYFSSRKQRKPVFIYPRKQFGLEWVDFDPKRKTVMIVHGFLSKGTAQWVKDMTKAFLDYDDVNVMAVDWSGGGNTWKYWNAVANTRIVGQDLYDIFSHIINATGAQKEDFYFIGHSLGAHICAFTSVHLGGVGRLTGLDPAQPCFRDVHPHKPKVERVDSKDADFVDIIHTNGRHFSKGGFGLADPLGHADFYINGGLLQPGCGWKSDYFGNNTFDDPGIELKSLYDDVCRAICSHGRSYELFTESIKFRNCTFSAFHWDLTYASINDTLKAACSGAKPCSVMGIDADGRGRLPRASGTYFVLTNSIPPYCEVPAGHLPDERLLSDLRNGYTLKPLIYSTASPYDSTTEKPKSWFQCWLSH